MIEIAEWLWEHWRTLTVSGLIAVVLRELTKHMVNRTVEDWISPQARDIREIKHNLKLIQEQMGVEGEWSGNAGISFEKARRSLNRSFTGFSRVILRRTLKLRRKRKMQIKFSKAWVAAMLVYAIAELAKHYNLKLPEGWEQQVYDFVLPLAQYGSFLIAAWWDKHIAHKSAPQSPQEDAEPPKSYQELQPIIASVHREINNAFEKAKSGKVTDETQAAIDFYLAVHKLTQKDKQEQKGA